MYPEKVDAAKVKGVAKLLTHGVGFVVAVSEFMLVAHQPGGHAAQLVSISPLRAGLVVDIR